MQENENKLEKIMRDMIEEGNNLRCVLSVWKTLTQKESTDILNKHEKSLHFFEVVRFTCNRYLYLSICKIFDMSSHNETSSLKYLKKALAKSQNTELVSLVDDFLREKDTVETLKKMTEIRNQYVAHNQMDKEKKATGKTWDDAFKLIEKTCEVINQVADDIHFGKIISVEEADKRKAATHVVLHVLEGDIND